MDNQHKKIKGYRNLSQGEIDTINAIKEQGEKLRIMIEEMNSVDGTDPRWLSVAKTHLQQGIMAAVRAVAKPDSF
jgi:hypothetical protein